MQMLASKCCVCRYSCPLVQRTCRSSPEELEQSLTQSAKALRAQGGRKGGDCFHTLAPPPLPAIYNATVQWRGLSLCFLVLWVLPGLVTDDALCPRPQPYQQPQCGLDMHASNDSLTQTRAGPELTASRITSGNLEKQ